MSDNPSKRLDPNTVLAAAQNSNDPSVQQAILALLQRQSELVDLELSEKKLTIGQREEKLRIEKAARDQNINDIKKNLIQEQHKQNVCQHRKPAPSHEPAIGGQRDHQHKTHFICLYCGKYWFDTELPGHLYINSERIGGPIL